MQNKIIFILILVHKTLTRQSNQIEVLTVSTKQHKNLKDVGNISEKLKSYLDVFRNLSHVYAT